MNRFNLDDNIQKALKKNDFLIPTDIQIEVIPLVLEGFDILAKAQTGSGKTAAFVLPILHEFIQQDFVKKSKISTLILTPTRELSIQVSSTFELLSKDLEYKPKIVTVIGGASLGEQLIDIQKGCDIIVATSGRLLDIISKKQINLRHVRHLVLDEADKMLDLGFEEELNEIMTYLSNKRQNLFFSATYGEKILKILSKISKNPKEVSIKNEMPTVNNIKQRAIKVNTHNRSELLRVLIKQNSFKKVLVFMANKRAADNIANKFRSKGYVAESFHGNLDQNERNFTLDDFKNGSIKILFASDIASRGLHIDDIDCVVNYDLPRSSSDYIHRIGRTARAGKSGTAISFINSENFEHFKLIEERSDVSLIKEEIEGFEYKGELVVNKKGQAAIKGKRPSKKDKLRASLKTPITHKRENKLI